MWKYFLDESGNAGDLINQKNFLGFGSQPIFALASVGVDGDVRKDELQGFISGVAKKHAVDNFEIKSRDLYFKKPEFILDLVSHMVESRFPFFVEVVDKRYCIAFSILTHQITPAYSLKSNDELTEVVLNNWADYLSNNLPEVCYEKFFKACENPSCSNINESMLELLRFVEERSAIDDAAPFIAKLVRETMNDYAEMREQMGDKADCIFVPIPDHKTNGDSIKLTPHVHSIYNIFARLNKYHLGEVDDLTLYHDRQDDLKDVLIFCAQNISDPKGERGLYVTDHADYRVGKPIKLEFMNSEDHIGIQVADVLAGFVSRYVHGFAYKKIEVARIYDEIFNQILKYNRPMSALGVNFVLPESRRQIIFDKFSL